MSNIVFKDENIAHDLRVRIEDAVSDAFRISEVLGAETQNLTAEIRLYDDVMNEKRPGKTIGAEVIADDRFVIGIDPDEVKKPEFIDKIGLKEHLSPTRANGLVSMIKQLKMYAIAFKTQLN